MRYARKHTAALAGLLFVLAGCASSATTTTAVGTLSTVATDNAIATYGAENLYTVTASAAVPIASLLSTSQKASLKALDNTAYDWVVKLRTEAQAGAIIADDVASATQALADFAKLVNNKGATP